MRGASMRVAMVACVVVMAGCGGQPQPAQEQAPAPQVHGDMAQLMRGLFFPNANVVFAAQGDDPAQVPPATEPSLATNPLASTYGGWQAVENAGLALADAANLLTVPRPCSNGQAAPVDADDWKMFVQELRDTGVAAYQAAQSKNQDAIVDVSDKVTTACANCHDVYRDKSDAQGGASGRCRK